MTSEKLDDFRSIYFLVACCLLFSFKLLLLQKKDITLLEKEYRLD
jgi:hypothetical protein